MSVDLASLGNVAVHQGQYEQATNYLQEALEIARRVGDIWLLGAVLIECGELYLKQQRIDEAFTPFDEARTISAKGNQEVIASSLYGLARVSAARGDMAAAQHQGQESLSLFEAMGNRMREGVKSGFKLLLETSKVWCFAGQAQASSRGAATESGHTHLRVKAHSAPSTATPSVIQVT